jgi:PAS domain S-box-containing protein
MKRFYKVPHFWGILTIMYIGALVYYADQLPIYRNVITLLPLELARYSTYRILSIVPVAYAAFVFGLRGGVITAIFISLALLPRALFFSPQVSEAVTETMAFLFIGLLVSLLIHRQQLAFHQLENAQQELRSDVQIIKYERKRLAALNQILNIVSASLDLDRILNNAIDSVVDVMQVDVAWVFLLDEENSELILTTQRGISEEFVQRKYRIRLGEGFNGKVAETGETLFVEDASKDPRLTREVISDYNICSSLIVPLRCKAKICGTLCTAMYSHRWFRPEEVELLTAIGDEIGIAVENAHLYQKQQVIAQQLQLSEERYRGVFESASEAIFVYSASGRIISANRACEQLTGYTQDELLATTVYELFSAVGADKLGQLSSGELERVVIGESGELRLARKDGAEAFIQLKISPLLRDDQIIGLQAIARDVTEERRLRQNMEYYVTQITRAQEDERLRISRELHDDTAQVLAGLSRELNSLLAKEGEYTKSTKESLEKLRRTADSAMEEVRRFSQDLRPSILDDLGLVPALEWLTTQLEKAFGLAAKVSITGNQHRLPPENELTVFRIAQEALSNVKRHSQATAVEMTIDFGDEALTLVVRDNGQGFKMPQRTSDLVLSGSLGIIGMRERARLIGGTLIVQSELGIGTTVTLRMPG